MERPKSSKKFSTFVKSSVVGAVAATGGIAAHRMTSDPVKLEQRDKRVAAESQRQMDLVKTNLKSLKDKFLK
jgi:hypothetical protein